MVNLWSIVGWILFGGVFGYSTTRWKWVYVVVLASLAVSFIVDPSAPDLRLGEDGGESWLNTLAFLAGLIGGDRIAKREMANG